MELSDLGGDPFDHPGGNGSFGQPPVHHAVLGETLHLDGVLDHLPRAFPDEDPALVPTNLHHSQINLPGEPAVEGHFLLAVIPPFFKRSKVQEPEVYRLFNLVNVIPGKKNGRYVRLHQVHGSGLLRVNLGILQRGNQRGEIHEEILDFFPLPVKMKSFFLRLDRRSRKKDKMA